jgi:hypothetical protein
MRRLLLLPASVIALSACEPPPDAPDGLDAASSFVIREFYNDDASFEAGLQGFMNWFYDEGEALVGLKPTDIETEGDEEGVDSFSVGALTESDVDHLPENPDGSGIEFAGGVVSLAEMTCPWQVAEDFLVRPDQNDVFDAWEGYDRTYRNSLDVFNTATDELSFTAITDTLNPQASGFDHGEWERSILFTENQADADTFLGTNLEPYPLFLDIRHGVFDLADASGEVAPTGVFAILTYVTGMATNAAGNNGLLQSYSIEINVQRPGDKTLRMLAVWAEPMLGGTPIHPGDALFNASLNQSVATSLDQSNQLDEKCTAWSEGNDLPETTSCNAAADAPSAGWLGLLVLPLVVRRRR